MERGWNHLFIFMYNTQPWTLSNEKARLGNCRKNMLSLSNQTRKCWKLYQGWFFFIKILNWITKLQSFAYMALKELWILYFVHHKCIHPTFHNSLYCMMMWATWLQFGDLAIFLDTILLQPWYKSRVHFPTKQSITIVWWSDMIITSVSWLLMSWQCLKMEHYQEWYRFNIECVGPVHMPELNTVSTVSPKVLATNGAYIARSTEWWCFILLVII